MAPDYATVPRGLIISNSWTVSTTTLSDESRLWQPVVHRVYSNGADPITANDLWLDVESATEKRVRLARERTRRAIVMARRETPAPLEERLYHRPRRVGRACGSRHRVMLC